MRKSPLSTPSGSRGKAFRWQSPENTYRTGYGYSCQVSPTDAKNDYIPLDANGPDSDQSRNKNWHNHSRNNRNSGGFSNYRNNYSPKSHYNNSFSPYKTPGNKQFGHKKGFQKGAHRQVNISRYVDVKSFLEDPWADLTKKIISDEKEICKNENLSNSTSCKEDDSEFSQESKNSSSDSFLETSKADSSLDLKLDDIKFSQESKSGSFTEKTDSNESHIDSKSSI